MVNYVKGGLSSEISVAEVVTSSLFFVKRR